MRRETNQWLMAFSVSFGVTFLAMAVVLGGICFVSYTRTGLGMAEVEKPQAARPDAYLPDREDRLVMLVAGTEEEGQPPDSYLLLGFLPDKGKIALCVLPAITYLEHGGQGTTLGRMWQQGGLGYVQKGLSQYLGIPIHRRATVTVEGLDALMAYGGLLDYQLGVDLDYPFHGRQVVMPRGRDQLDSRRVMDIIGYPAYRGGERERSDRAALLLSQLISRDLPLFLGEEGERLQRTALTVMDTDLSAADCLRRAPAGTAGDHGGLPGGVAEPELHRLPPHRRVQGPDLGDVRGGGDPPRLGGRGGRPGGGAGAGPEKAGPPGGKLPGQRPPAHPGAAAPGEPLRQVPVRAGPENTACALPENRVK